MISFCIIFSALLNEADGDLDLAQKGIVVLDEFDKKILRKENGVNGKIDVGGEAIVHELLKMLEGTKVKITFNAKDLGIILPFEL